jgi:hypothetical protein
MSATTAPPPDHAADTFPCPRCGLAHPWAPEFAGRTARCGCGHVLKVPASIPGAPSSPRARSGAPSRTTAPQPAERPAPTPTTGADDPSQVPAFLRMSLAGGDDSLPADVEAELAATGKYGEEDLTKPDDRRDLHVPAALLVVGFILTLVDFAASKDGVFPVVAGVLFVSAKLLIGMILMLGGALLAARFSGVDFGPLGPALLKLAGLCLAPSAAGDLLTTLLGGDMAVAYIGWTVRLVLYWALVSYLFRLDGAQTMAVVGTISAVKFVTTIVVASFLMAAFAQPMPAATPKHGRRHTIGPNSAIMHPQADSDSDEQ